MESCIPCAEDWARLPLLPVQSLTVWYTILHSLGALAVALQSPLSVRDVKACMDTAWGRAAQLAMRGGRWTWGFRRSRLHAGLHGPASV